MEGILVFFIFAITRSSASLNIIIEDDKIEDFDIIDRIITNILTEAVMRCEIHENCSTVFLHNSMVDGTKSGFLLRDKSKSLKMNPNAKDSTENSPTKQETADVEALMAASDFKPNIIREINNEITLMSQLFEATICNVSNAPTRHPTSLPVRNAPTRHTTSLPVPNAPTSYTTPLPVPNAPTSHTTPLPGKCPSTHPYAYYHGKYCCSTARENVYAPHGSACDGGTISLDSLCCEKDQGVNCPHRECVNQEFYYEHIGCYLDAQIRAISGIKRTYTTNDVIQSCYRLALSLGYQFFAVQLYAQCFTSSDAGSTYNRYGEGSGCNDGQGGTWRNDVYRIKVPNVPTRHPTTVPETPAIVLPNCAKAGCDYKWNDLVTLENVESWLSCSRACVGESQCVLWTYGTNEKVCYLKKQTARYDVTDQGRICGTRGCGLL